MPDLATPRHDRAPSALRLAAVLVAALATTPTLAASTVAAVSPGSPDALLPAAGPCPTFSWTYDPAARGYEVVIYRVDAAAGESLSKDESPVLRQRLPAGAVSWTPPADRCLRAGEDYVWFVRSQAPEGSDAWSEGSLFRIAESGVAATSGTEETTAEPGEAAARRKEDASPAGASRSPLPPAPAAAAGASGLAPKAGGALFTVSGGIAAAGNYGFTSPRTVHRAFPPAAFLLADSHEDDRWFIEPSGVGAIRGGSGTLDVRLALGVDDLPLGALVKTLACRVRDSEDGEDMSGSFRLERRFVTSGTGELMAEVAFATSGSSDQAQLAVTHAIAHPVVASFYHYSIRGTITVEGDFFTLAFLGCELEYEVDRLETR